VLETGVLQKLLDELARDFARQVFLVDGIADMARVRALNPYFVRGMVILAPTQMAAAELVAKEGEEVAVSTMRGRHRVVKLPRGGWAVVSLPPWLGFLGKSGEPDEH
jgi:hypothetical protein